MVDSPYASVLTKADLEGEAMKRGSEDPGEMTAFDRSLIPVDFLRLEVPLKGNRFQIRRCAQLIRDWSERIDAATRRGEISDRQVSLEVWALTRCLQEALRPERRKEQDRQRRLRDSERYAATTPSAAE